ncbi:nucleoside hydrolase [Kribbella sp. GL6]|uniref:nucleoside hydrolase n=1 Tax=Kribbella sp. GL6 TaxID=3419765 RepID=UPI003D07FD69
MIIDTDAGGDLDDSVALVVAGRLVPELGLVVTGDEFGGERARFVRWLLDLVGRPEVGVVAGADLGNRRGFVVGGMCPGDVPWQGTDVAGAVDEVMARCDGPVPWVGMGPMSNLAALQRERPELVARMVVTQMGGAVNYRDPARAEHNFRADPAAAIEVLPALERWGPPTFVTSDVTFDPAMELTADSRLYQRWTEPGATPWERVLREQFDRWTAKYVAMQHDALALAAALLWPGVRFARERVVLDELARMSLAPDGTEIAMSVSADYPAFMRWLEQALVRR